MFMKKALPFFLTLVLAVVLNPTAGWPMGLGNTAPVIDSLTANPNPVAPENTSIVTCTAHDTDGSIVQYVWTCTGGLFANGTTSETHSTSSNTDSVVWTAPATLGSYTVSVRVYDNGGAFGGSASTSKSITITVEATNASPTISSLTAEPATLLPSETAQLTCTASDADGDTLSYVWSATGGSFTGQDDADPYIVTWYPPATTGSYSVTVTVTDGKGGSASESISLSVVLTKEASSIGGLINPVRIATDENGNIYLTDSQKKQLIGFDPYGSIRLIINGFSSPLAVAVDDRDRIMVGDAKSGEVKVYDSTSQYLYSLGQGEGQFQMPNDMTIDTQSGQVFVVDSLANAVQVFDSQGRFLFQFGSFGSLTGQFNFPTGVTFDPVGGQVLVADHNNGRVQIFTPSGLFVATFGYYGSGSGKLTRPQGLTVSSDGYIYVADAFQSSVQVFDSQYASIGFIGSYGDGKGELRLPMDVVIDTYNRLLVSSANNGRIEAYNLAGGGLIGSNTAPTTPVIKAPLSGQEVATFYPLLEVYNSTDAEGDPLTYDFEVYRDAYLYDVVASVYGVAEGSGGTTSWSLTQALAENTYYYWRARSNDGQLVSQWTPLSSFYVNTYNEPPSNPSPEGTPGADMRPSNALSWSAPYDPDALDTLYYVIEIDNQADFSSPEVVQGSITGTSITLESLSGYLNLLDDTTYYWRVKAVDSKGGESAWATSTFTFNRIEIDVNSQPTLAKVFLDGNYAYLGSYQGTTQMIIKDVAERRHTLQLQLAAYALYYGLADNRNGQDALIDTVLSPAPKGVKYPPGNGQLITTGTALTPIQVVSPAQPITIDWDWDGRKDLLVKDGQGDLHLHLNDYLDGQPSFPTEQLITSGGQPFTLGPDTNLFVVDWDNDGFHDLLVGDENGKVKIYLYNGTETVPQFTVPTNLQVAGNDIIVANAPGLHRPAVPFVVDWNNDGQKDLLIGDSSGYISLYINSGDDASPVFDQAAWLMAEGGYLQVPGAVLFTFVIDMDYDGDKDLLIGSDDGHVYQYLNYGSDDAPLFSKPTLFGYDINKPISFEGTTLYLFIVDWNNDKVRDLVMGDAQGQVWLYLGSTKGKQ